VIRPSRMDFTKAAKRGHILPVVKDVAADRLTPIDAFYALGASYLLESAGGGAFGRYSFLGVERVAGLKIEGEEVEWSDEEGRRSFRARDPVRAIGDLMRSRPWDGEGDLSPFPGGAVGYLGYDAARLWERLPDVSGKAGPEVPDGLFMITRYTLVFDNLMHSLRIVCNQRIGVNGSDAGASGGEDPETDYIEAIRGIERIEAELARADSGRDEIRRPPMAGPLVSDMDEAAFSKGVLRAKALIEEGEAIQVVLSRSFNADFDGSPFDVYRALRSINPSPYMFYLDFSSFVLLGASPEVMVRVEDGKAILRPLAGTRKRGKDAAEDAALRTELLSDEKERAEHIMLIDLARNDLGRVAKAGSVTVDRMMEVENYSHVMHIVSEVSCRLAPEVDLFDVIRATFPAGTVSGAPKIRAMEIIDEIETARRGPYAGLVGYFSYRGGFDSCIAIRSALVKGGKIRVQAGAGIVYDSIPEKEFQETAAKAAATLAAVGKARG
jgi:anthranilate synthase component I